MVLESFLSTVTVDSEVWTFLVLLWVPTHGKLAGPGVKVERLTLATELGLSAKSLREPGTCVLYFLIHLHS
jgi:hypothetical protein